MAYEIFYTVNGEKDSMVIEGESIEEIKILTRVEMDRRNATYHYSIWLND